ncbi:uncharacterized protein B0H18DRAFT_1120602 [Fomitopsis serialis]|uniref:uncharacterized protein n=1 Tax=Fomitopsis serialis TaxID=139415 RepID=UPI0020086B28|nr:uncharacterized protein B0H18DRAFT_1120602 [Neoantrodia serialis]KAH9923079.1 hypothetical protein B0H18DRAFT_1120602 [Neoantrodia serialis]
MTTVQSFWALTLKPGERVRFSPAGHTLHITQAALDKDQVNRDVTYVELTYPTGSYSHGAKVRAAAIICSLTPGTVNQSVLDVWLAANEEYEFEATGATAIHLLGYYSGSLTPTAGQGLTGASEAGSAQQRKRARTERDSGEQARASHEAVGQATGSTRPSAALPNRAMMFPAMPRQITAERPASSVTRPSSGPTLVEPKENAPPNMAGVHVHNIDEGQGREVKAGDYVNIHFTGKVKGTNAYFVDTISEQQTLRLHVSVDKTLPGLANGITGMKAGGRRILELESHAAYGDTPVLINHTPVPPKSVLIFDVRVVSILPSQALSQ